MRLVIPCVEYDDHLALSLPAWGRRVDPASITVVTSEDDVPTQRLADAHGARVLVTDAWTRADPSYTRDVSHWHSYWRTRGTDPRTIRFNKALALDEAFGFVGDKTHTPSNGELCLSADADCIPQGTLPPEWWAESGVIYGCRRYKRTPTGEQGSEEVIRGRGQRSQHRRFTCVMEGYFQMFRYRAGLRFGSYPAADGYDSDFAEFEFPRPGQEVPGFFVLTTGKTHTDWPGRTTPRIDMEARQ